MLLTTLVLLAALLPKLEDGASSILDAHAARPAAAVPDGPPRYDPATRAVSNWHAEAGANLLPRALALTASLSGDPPYVARCVRLNNGWCIKSARWPGEIGADGEGHTAFATMADGADAAANLLRRYVTVHGRHTALAIVRRWAPAECRVAGAPARSASVPRPAVSAALAPRGLGRTVRARYLAGHRPAGAMRGRAALRVQPWSPLAQIAGRTGGGPTARKIPRVAAMGAAMRPVPDIAAGIEASKRASRTQAPERTLRGADDPTAFLDRRQDLATADRMVAESALLPAIAAGLPLLDLRLPAPLCSGDEARIQAYAARIAGSVGLRPGDDLDPFGPDGAPRPNLAPVMLAMSAVELGTLRAGPALVAAAIARLATAPPVAGGR